MNKTDVKFKQIKVLVGQDLGKEIDNFLREDIELIGLQIKRKDNYKIAYIKYVDREYISNKYQENGGVFESYNYANYHHAIEVVVPQTQDLAEKMNEVFANNEDMESMNEFYFEGNNTDNVIILYASRKEVEANEEAAREAQQKRAEELAGVKVEELAQQGVKEPEIVEEDVNVVEKYATLGIDETGEGTDEAGEPIRIIENSDDIKDEAPIPKKEDVQQEVKTIKGKIKKSK